MQFSEAIIFLASRCYSTTKWLQIFIVENFIEASHFLILNNKLVILTQSEIAPLGNNFTKQINL